MKRVTTSDRLKQIMKERNLDSFDILNACKPLCERFGIQLENSLLDQYISGSNEPDQDKLSILSRALDVNEVWLMGYDVPQSRDLKQYSIGTPDEIEEENKRINELTSFFVELTEEQQKMIIRMIKAIVEE